MDSKIFESGEGCFEVATQDVVLETCRAYEETAHDYASATLNYESYPGLWDEVLEFERTSPPDLPLLDLGCGGGRDSRLLADVGRKVIAGDFAMAMLRITQEAAKKRQGAMGCVRLNMLDLPFHDGVLGGVWACGSILHVPSGDIPRVLSEVLRTLVPDGVVAISMRAGESEGWREGGTLAGRRWFSFVDPDDFAKTMTSLGFCGVKIRFTGRRDWFVALGRRAGGS